MTNPIDQRPEHYAEINKGEMVCTQCGEILGPGKSILCAKAPRTVHGIDLHLYWTDPIYHKLVYQTRALMRAYRDGMTVARSADLRRRHRDAAQFERLYDFTADDWAAAKAAMRDR